MNNQVDIIDLLNNPKSRELVDAIEDIESSLRDKDWNDHVLVDAHTGMVTEMKEKFGYDWKANR